MNESINKTNKAQKPNAYKATANGTSTGKHTNANNTKQKESYVRNF